MTADYMELDDLVSATYPIWGAPTWQEMIPYLQSLPDHWETVTNLYRELFKHGEFREPIVLDDESSFWEDELHDGRMPVIDGTHRVVASILANVPVVKVVLHSEQARGDLTECLVTEVEFPPTVTMDEVFDTYVSIPFPETGDDGWLTCEGLAYKEGQYTLTWNEESVEERLFPAMHEHLQRFYETYLGEYIPLTGFHTYYVPLDD